MRRSGLSAVSQHRGDLLFLLLGSREGLLQRWSRGPGCLHPHSGSKEHGGPTPTSNCLEKLRSMVSGKLGKGTRRAEGQGVSQGRGVGRRFRGAWGNCRYKGPKTRDRVTFQQVKPLSATPELRLMSWS